MIEVLAALALIFLLGAALNLISWFITDRHKEISDDTATKPLTESVSTVPSKSEGKDAAHTTNDVKEDNTRLQKTGGLQSPTTGCTLYLKGSGLEFSASRLSYADIQKMNCLATKDMDEFLSAGRLASNAGVSDDRALVSQIYGPDPLDAEFGGWVGFPDEEAPTLTSENCIQAQLFEDPSPRKNVADYISVATGKVFGSISIPISHPSEFKQQKLKIKYFEFSLDGFPEQYGRIIESIEYDGHPLELEWEDNGLDTNLFIFGYQLDDQGELEDYLVICSRQENEDFVFDWDASSVIFDKKDKHVVRGPDQISNRNVFIACIDPYLFEEKFSEHGLFAANDLLNHQITTLMEVSTNHLGTETKYFISISSEIFEVKDSFSIDMENLAKDCDGDFSAALEGFGGAGYFHFIIVTNGSDHWDSSFLQMSSDIGEFGFNIWGLYEPIGQLAVQGYHDGDFDTGIIHDAEMDGHYTQTETSTMEHYGVTPKMFDLERYATSIGVFYDKNNSRKEATTQLLEKNVFIACIDQYYFQEKFSDFGESAANNFLNDTVTEMMDAITEHLGADTKYFISISQNLFEVQDSFFVNIGEMRRKHNEDFETFLKRFGGAGYFHLIIVTSGSDHWDSSFLRISSDIGEFGFNIWGLYDPIGQLAVQGYHDGDFDTGIIHDAEMDGHYTQTETSTMEHYGVTPKMFDLEQYQENL